MKKFLKITLSLLLLVMIGYFAYKHYKKTEVLLNKIHVDATSVLKIGIHDLKETLVFDVITAPGFYWENTSFSDSEKEKDTIDTIEKGIDLTPYSLVFYTMKDVENTLFTTIEIEDTDTFELYIANYLKEKAIKKVIHEAGYSFAVNKKSKLVLAWNKKKLAVAISPEIKVEKYATVFIDVLKKNLLISDENHSYIKKLKKANDHIFYIRKENRATINFKDGEAILNGTFYTEMAQKYYPEVTYNTLENASLEMYFDANFENEENKKEFIKNIEEVSFFKNNNIDVTSFANRTNGFLHFAIKGTTMQEDTIVTYTYDDNFEKVAQKTIEQKEVPKIILNLGSENESLNDYFIKQGIIENNILTAIPYYTFYAKEDAMNTTYTTLKKKLRTQKKISDSFFNLKVDFNPLHKDLAIPRAEEFFSLMNKLDIKAKQLEEKKVVLKGNLTTTREDVNIISHFFFGIKNKKSL